MNRRSLTTIGIAGGCVLILLLGCYLFWRRSISGDSTDNERDLSSQIKCDSIADNGRELQIADKSLETGSDEAEHKQNTYTKKMPDGQVQEWYDEPDSIPDIPRSISHRSDCDAYCGYYKYFSTVRGKPFYYNSRHGYYVMLPKGMGYNQRGENMMGAHDNEFYNSDTTLVVSAHAYFYDVVLLDCPQYEDSLRKSEKDFLKRMGKYKINRLNSGTWISEGRINHNNPDNPAAQRYIRKWVLKKDIDNRECEMALTIYFNDSDSSRMPEFKRIIRQFPNKPNL